jgi:hypothetical protein
LCLYCTIQVFTATRRARVSGFCLIECTCGGVVGREEEKKVGLCSHITRIRRWRRDEEGTAEKLKYGCFSRLSTTMISFFFFARAKGLHFLTRNSISSVRFVPSSSHHYCLQYCIRTPKYPSRTNNLNRLLCWHRELPNFLSLVPTPSLNLPPLASLKHTPPCAAAQFKQIEAA